MSGSISQLENIEHHTLCPWICLIVLITIIRINMFVAYWTYLYSAKSHWQMGQGPIPTFLCLHQRKFSHSSGCLFKFIVLEKCAEEFWSTLWCLHCGFLGIHFCLLFINYSNIITYCSLKFLSSCDLILDLLHVLNCDPESRIWRGPGGGGSFQRSRGGGGGRAKKKKKEFFFFFFFGLPPPLPPSLYICLYNPFCW